MAVFQSTRPVRGATSGRYRCSWIRYHFNPRAPCGARPEYRHCTGAGGRFQSTRPVRGATAHIVGTVPGLLISIHAPRAGRDARRNAKQCQRRGISIHAPRAGRDGRRQSAACRWPDFNPRAPCGARPQSRPAAARSSRRFQSTRPVRGATTGDGPPPGPPLYFNPRAPCGARHISILRILTLIKISIHAPRAGRDSKSIQNYFTHFCDKRQFLDNFTQNAAF